MSWLDDVDGDDDLVVPRGSAGDDPLTIHPKLFDGLKPADMMDNLSKAWSDGMRFKDFNDDRGIYDLDTFMGQQTKVQVDVQFENGLRELNNKRYKEAITHFTEALKLAIKIRNNGEDLGFLFNSRSQAHRLMKQYELALKDAKSAMRCFPTLIKVGLNLASALECLGDFSEAFVVCARALLIYNTDTDHKSQYLKLAVRLASKVEDGWEALSEQECPKDVWNLVIADFAKEGAWSTVRILLMGTDDLTALVSSCDASKVSLSGLVESCRELSWKQWGQKLALLMIKNGAKYESLCAEGKYPFHVALRIGLKSDTFDLLRWLLNNKSHGDIVDKNKNSLLHVVCRSKASAKSTAIKLLMNNKIDPDLKNKDGKLALDYLAKDDPDYDLIRKKMAGSSQGGKSTGGNGGSSTAVVPFGGSATAGAPHSQVTGIPQPSTESFEHVKSWSKTRVKKWFDTNNLGQLKQNFRELDGPLLFELKMMQVTAPEMFFKLLETSLNFSLLDVLKLSSSLRDLSQDVIK